VIQDYRLVDFQLLPNSLDQFGLLLLEINITKVSRKPTSCPWSSNRVAAGPSSVKYQPEGATLVLSDSGRGIWGL